MLPCGWRLIRWAAAVGKKRGRSHHQSLSLSLSLSLSTSLSTSLSLTHTHTHTHKHTHTDILTPPQTHIEASLCPGPRGSGPWKTDTNNSQIQSSPHREKETSILHFPTDPLLKAKDQPSPPTPPASPSFSPLSPELALVLPLKPPAL